MAEWDMTIIKEKKRYPYDKARIRNAIIQAYNQICYPDFDEIDMLLDEIEDLIKSKLNFCQSDINVALF